MTSAVPRFMMALSELVIGLNQNLVKRDASRALTLLERETLAIIHRALYRGGDDFYQRHAQDDASTLGILNSGGTISNITALWIARNSSFRRSDGTCVVEDIGLSAALAQHGCNQAVVICSAFAHYSIQKAAGILGIGERNVVTVGSDRKGRMDLHALTRTVEDCCRRGDRILAIVGTAGTTDCGSIDPLREISAIARAVGSHFHVDAAWGGSLLFSQRFRDRLAGIELADSVTIDAHKQFYVPVGSSILLLRDPLAPHVIEKHSRYMLQEDSGDLGRRSLEGSRSGATLFLHAGLHVIGTEGYGLLAEDSIRKARLMTWKLRSRGFQLLIAPQMNVVLYRFIPAHLRRAAFEGELTSVENAAVNDLNEKIQKVQSERGRAFVSRTTLHNVCGNVPVVALRAVLANPFTSASDIDFVLADQLEIAERLSESGVASVNGRIHAYAHAESASGNKQSHG
jgi:glutamate decarboxylase